VRRESLDWTLIVAAASSRASCASTTSIITNGRRQHRGLGARRGAAAARSPPSCSSRSVARPTTRSTRWAHSRTGGVTPTGFAHPTCLGLGSTAVEGDRRRPPGARESKELLSASYDDVPPATGESVSRKMRCCAGVAYRVRPRGLRHPPCCTTADIYGPDISHEIVRLRRRKSDSCAMQSHLGSRRYRLAAISGGDWQGYDQSSHKCGQQISPSASGRVQIRT
jgi:hypothetical protein